MQQIEEALEVYGRAIYTQLGIRHNTYSTWRTDGTKPSRRSAGEIHNALRDRFSGITKKGKMIITERAVFLKQGKKKSLAR